MEIEYHCLGYDESSGKILYIFVNPYRLPEHGNNPSFADVIVDISICHDDDGDASVSLTNVSVIETGAYIQDTFRQSKEQYEEDNTHTPAIQAVIDAYGTVP